MFKLSVGALFKNESHCLKEWLEHYIAHGVEHFFLIDDKSTDDYMTILNPYIEKGLVTLFCADCNYYLGRQRDLYNTYIFPCITKTEWLLMVDLDEFVWSPKGTNFIQILELYFKDMAQIQINHTYFGSNGHIKQPEYIVKGFTRRSKDVPSESQGYKYFINTKYKFSSLNVHHADHIDVQDKLEKFKIFSQDWWRLNHYSCQSREFWINVKCTRGDADNFRVRSIDEGFIDIDQNDVEDLGLLEQNTQLGLY
jgi:hypothetical protein